MDERKKRVLLDKLQAVRNGAFLEAPAALLAVVSVLEEVIHELGPTSHADAVSKQMMPKTP